MPNIKSAKKRVALSKAAYEKNKADKSALKTAVKKFEAAVASGNREQADSAYKAAVKSVDQGVKKGILHKNNAARKKSSMTLKQLSEVSGVPASSLSEYMSGKCAPRANALQRLADALQTTPEDLCSPAKRSRWRISVKEAAACMDVPPSFIKRGLQTGALSIGSAVLCKERYRYFISPERLRAEVGPERFAQFWEGGV